MRLQSLPLIALLAVGISSPVFAQIGPLVTPDTVVARLMSFDLNSDGKIVAGELPERMQSLVVRGDTGNDGALDSTEVRWLATAPGTIPGPNGTQPGHWGVGVNFDTSKQIQDALDDLRLAADVKERALEVVRKFQADAPARAQANLMITMQGLLTADQLKDFKAVPEAARTVTVPAIRRDGVTIFGATAEEAAGQERVKVTLRERVDLAGHIEQYGLDAARKQKALAAINQAKSRATALTESDRSTLTEQLRGLLTDEQRNDLYAALGRRPIVKAPTVVDQVFTIQNGQGGSRTVGLNVVDF
jgi:hypothetical protein